METIAFPEAKRTYNRIGLKMVIASLLFGGLQIAAQFVIAFFEAKSGVELNANRLYIFTMLPDYMIAYPIIMLMLKKSEGEEPEKRDMSVWQIVSIFLISYAGMYIANMVGAIITTVIGGIKGSPIDDSVEHMVSSLNPIALFVMTVILAPLFEEIVFRKLLISRTMRYGEVPAIIVSSMMFSLFHGNIGQGVYAFVIGLVFGYVYVRTGKIKYTIILHMLINFTGSIVGLILMKIVPIEALEKASREGNTAEMMRLLAENKPQMIIYNMYTVLMIGMVIAGIVLFVLNLKKIHFEQRDKQILKGHGFRTVVFTPGIIIYLLIWVCIITLNIVL